MQERFLYATVTGPKLSCSSMRYPKTPYDCTLATPVSSIYTLLIQLTIIVKMEVWRYPPLAASLWFCLERWKLLIKFPTRRFFPGIFQSRKRGISYIQ